MKPVQWWIMLCSLFVVHACRKLVWIYIKQIQCLTQAECAIVNKVFRVWMLAVSSVASCLDRVEGIITRLNWDAISTQADRTPHASWSLQTLHIIKQEFECTKFLLQFRYMHANIKPHTHTHMHKSLKDNRQNRQKSDIVHTHVSPIWKSVYSTHSI